MFRLSILLLILLIWVPCFAEQKAVELRFANPDELELSKDILDHSDEPKFEIQEFPTDWDLPKFLSTGSVFDYRQNVVVINDANVDTAFQGESQVENIYGESKIGMMCSLDSDSFLKKWLSSLGVRAITGMVAQVNDLHYGILTPQIKTIVSIPVFPQKLSERLHLFLHAARVVPSPLEMFEFHQQLNYKLVGGLAAVARLDYNPYENVDRPWQKPWFGVLYNSEF